MNNNNSNNTTEETLCDVCNGAVVRITCLRGEEGTCHRLRELGFCERAQIRKVSDNGALICNVKDSQIAISEELAKNVFVEDVI